MYYKFLSFFLGISVLCAFGYLEASDTPALTIALSSSSSTTGAGLKNSQKVVPARVPLFVAITTTTGTIDTEKTKTDLKRMLSRLKKYLELSGQFVVTGRMQPLVKNKKEIHSLFPIYTCAFFIEYDQEKGSYQWRLYDTGQAALLKGKKYSLPGSSGRAMTPEEWAKICAHDMWYELLRETSSFMTKLCYIKKKKDAANRLTTQLCTADIDGAHEHVLLSNTKINIAPYWSPYSDFIFYSEFTARNVRLMALDMRGTRRVVLDLEGTLAGISASPSGHQIVYGRSGGIWRYEYDLIKRSGQHVLVIKERDTCACPTLLATGDIIYCCQGKIKRYTKATGSRAVIIDDGYCVGPAYHEKSGIIVYSQRINGCMQLMLYRVGTGTKEQLTCDAGDKIDPCWSPCGNFIVFGREHKAKNQIATIDIRTKKYTLITKENDACYYPSWSPVYVVKSS